MPPLNTLLNETIDLEAETLYTFKMKNRLREINLLNFFILFSSFL